MAKFYAVKEGKKPGIYHTWDECKEQVNKFPGAIYKSFKTLEEAEKYLHGDVLQTSDERLSTSKGFILVCYNGLSLGWGKITNGTIKNHYPKGLRINY